MPPLVSVLIPVYNTEEYLPACLDSVVGQSYKELDIVLLDDGSTDGSGAVCDAYAARDARVRVTHRENGGVASARGALLVSARGELVAWVDSDDVCAPDMLEYLLEGLTRAGADVAQCRVSREAAWDDLPRARWFDMRVLCREEMAELAAGAASTHVLTGKLCRRSLYDGLAFPPVPMGEDTFMLAALARRARRAALLPRAAYYYRQRAGSIVHSITAGDRVRASCLLLEWLEPEQALYETFFYAYVTGVAAVLAEEPGAYAENRAAVDAVLSRLRRELPRLLAGGQLGRLGRLEVRALAAGRPWGWRFSALCQRVYAYNAKRRARRC